MDHQLPPPDESPSQGAPPWRYLVTLDERFLNAFVESVVGLMIQAVPLDQVIDQERYMTEVVIAILEMISVLGGRVEREEEALRGIADHLEHARRALLGTEPPRAEEHPQVKSSTYDRQPLNDTQRDGIMSETRRRNHNSDVEGSPSPGKSDDDEEDR